MKQSFIINDFELHREGSGWFVTKLVDNRMMFYCAKINSWSSYGHGTCCLFAHYGDAFEFIKKQQAKTCKSHKVNIETIESLMEKI